MEKPVRTSRIILSITVRIVYQPGGKTRQIHWFDLVRKNELNQLTPANLSSLRWDYALEDPALEEDRIEQYKELRRQRYAEAQQQAMQKLIEKKKEIQ